MDPRLERRPRRGLVPGSAQNALVGAPARFRSIPLESARFRFFPHRTPLLSPRYRPNPLAQRQRPSPSGAEGRGFESRRAYHVSSGKTGIPKASPFWARSPVPTMRHPPSPRLSACVRRCPLLSAFERGYGAGPRPGLGPDLKCPTGVLSELLDAALAGRGRALR